MSMLLMAQAMNIKLGNPLRKLVLLKLADNANDNGECFPSYQHIADQCEISKRSAMNHISDLIKMGFLSKKARFNKDGSSSNLYQLHLEKGSAGDALGGAANSLGSAGDALGGSAGNAPITSHSINQSINHTTLTGCNAAECKPTPKKKSALALLAEFGITEQLAEDFIALRKAKKAPITETALNRLQKQADIAKLPLAEVVAIMLERGWTGFQADWNWGGGQTKPQNGTQSEKRGNVNVQADWSGLIL